MHLLKILIPLIWSAFPAWSQTQRMSGLEPHRRPKAPVLKQMAKLDPKMALRGIEGEVPPSLQKTVTSQGAWYTPLIEPGMVGPYDIRQYHSKEYQARATTYQKAQWDPIHFKPLIDQAKDEQCLKCHQNTMNQKVLAQNQVGEKASDVLAWYQTLDTYTGAQENLHWRHYESPFAKRVTQFQCTTCHQGNDPREEAWVPETAAGVTPPFTLRKGVNPKTCLMCHGQFPDPKIMNLPGKWPAIRDGFQNNCLACHAAFRTNRHNVNFLKPAEIEAAGQESGDSCFGCHGGRAWYRISYPYPRHAWTGMPPEVPDWAKSRPTESESRFMNKSPQSEGK